MAYSPYAAYKPHSALVATYLGRAMIDLEKYADVGYMASLGLPAPSLFTLLAIVIKIGGGLLMQVRYRTRLVSLGLYMPVADFVGHFQLGDLNS
jgi:putative oxidoreductase